MTEHEIPGVIPGIFGFFCTSKKKSKYEKKTVIRITWENTLRVFQSLVWGGGVKVK